MRVIDLYAGVGGWAVGFELAGLEIAESYEWWEPAAKTHRANSSSTVSVMDIRKLEFEQLPQNIDVVIGSPPCTQFSYSNRGGSGDVADGLIDIEQFLKVVRHVKPKAWAFENVPRVKRVLDQELTIGGVLEEYIDLFVDAKIEIFDMASYGIPQRRKRCIAGNFDFELLKSYSGVSAKPTLGEVVNALAKAKEPIYENRNVFDVFDNTPEEPLSWEEERFNRDMKEAHPIYNGMPFPDPLERSSRTVTATCTRVSRESLVILDPQSGHYRRLSVRERASLQSFPVGFQFQGKSHSEKLKMIGNAVPPGFTYLIAEAIKGTHANKLILPGKLNANAQFREVARLETTPDTAGRKYPDKRRFRFSIPNLHFKSGTRFEFSNVDGVDEWSVGFYFGDSKRIIRKQFQKTEVDAAIEGTQREFSVFAKATVKAVVKNLGRISIVELQTAWTRKQDGVHPFEILDNIGEIAASGIEGAQAFEPDELRDFVHLLLYGDKPLEKIATLKVERYLAEIAVGALIAAAINSLVLTHEKLLV